MPGNKWLGGLDDHELSARLLPGALVIAPLVAVGVAAGLRANPVVSVVIGLLGLGGISFALRAWVRSRGKVVEAKLARDRDGLPTRHALREGGDGWSQAQRTKWRASVADTTKTSLDTDEAIDAAVMQLRADSRDAAKYPLLAGENRTYGYERNLLGVRKAGVATGLIGAAVGGILTVAEPDVEGLSLDRLDLILATGLSLALVAFFVAYPSMDRVWKAGCDYAERLMETS